MRFVIQAQVPADIGNDRIRDGSLGKTIQAILEEQQPEAAYFTEIGGQRTAILVVNLDNPAEIVKYSEPWWLSFGGTVEWHPAMVAEDLMAAGEHFEHAVTHYG